MPKSVDIPDVFLSPTETSSKKKIKMKYENYINSHVHNRA
jgi:hypothetical protein